MTAEFLGSAYERRGGSSWKPFAPAAGVLGASLLCSQEAAPDGAPPLLDAGL